MHFYRENTRHFTVGNPKTPTKKPEEPEYFYSLYTETIKSPRTERLGVYFAFAFPAGSVEEADRFIAKAIASPFSDLIKASTKTDLYDGASYYFMGDSANSIRRSFLVNSIVRNQSPSASPPMGFPITDGEGAVVVAVDTFTRPDDGHLPKLAMFIQEQYAVSKAYSLEIMQKRVTQ